MSSFITVSDGAGMTSDFRAVRESMLASSYQNNDTLFICETFNKSHIETILSQTDCTGIRVYLGMNEDNRVVVILVGVNESGEDILSSGEVLERALRCPEECPPKSALNYNEP